MRTGFRYHKHILQLGLLACIVSMLWGCDLSSDPKKSEARPISSASKVSLQTATGQAVILPQKPNAWIFVNYWADWCKPCYQELPELARFAQKHRERGDALLLGVSFEPMTAKSLAEFASAQNIHYPILLKNPAKLWSIPEVKALPATAVIAPSGQFVKFLYGPQTVQSLEKAMG